MNNLKDAILERMINCGKKNKRLKTLVIILITLFLILFHGIRNFFMQFKLHPFRRRVLAVSLCVCLVVSSMPAADYAFPVLAAENSEEVQENGQEEIQENTHDGIYEIISFTELPDEVKEQTVAVGTPLESLALPDTLIALCRMPDEKTLEDNADSDKKQDSGEKDKQTDEGKEENTEEDLDEGNESNESNPGESDNQTGDELGDSGNEDEGNGDEAEDSNNGGEGKEDESGDSNNVGEEIGTEPGDSGNEDEGIGNGSGDSDNGDAEKPENSDSDNGETPEGSTDEEHGDAAENSTDEGSGEAAEANTGAGDAKAEGGTDEGDAGNKEVVETQETFTVTLRENYAMPDELPEIKELIYEEASDTSGSESGENGSGSGEGSDIEEREEETVTIGGITWECMPEYDGGIAGVYLFTPVISDVAYILAEDVKLPEITVTVAEAEIMLAEEETLEEDLPDVSGSTTPVCGVISSNTTWEKGTLIDGELIIKPGVTLTINDEVTLNGNVTIKGGGTILRGNGSKNSYITVTAGDDLVVGNIIIDGASISSNASMIRIFQGGNLTICDRCIIRNCITIATGGAISNMGGSLTIRDAIISNCSANAGGAIWNQGSSLYGRGELTMENTSINNCSADYNAGAIMNGGSSAILENITIENCSAGSWGGAIFSGISYVTNGIHYEPDLIIKNGTFINNKSIYTGGCISAQGGTLNIYGGEFTGNTSAGRGGCIYQDRSAGSVINISGGYFEGNTCTNSGYEGSGAVYISGTNGQLILSSDPHFCNDADGTDGIMIDDERKVLISHTLNYPATIYVAASEGRVIAEGKDGYILSLQKDINNIKFVDIGNSGEEYYTVLDEENNQIKLSTTDPYGYSITYINNGASGQVEDNTKYKEGDTITVKPADELSWEGHRFLEWNTQSDGSGTSYQPGEPIEKIKGDITLYAIFEEIEKFTATFYSGANNNKEEISAEINDETQTASLKAPSLAELRGYTAVGWNKSESGYTAEIAEGGKIEISENTSFYGVYKEEAVLSYDVNYGSGYEKERVTDYIYANVSEETINYNYPKLSLAPAPSRAGYTFNGWNTASDGTGDTYKASTDFELRGDTTLYAKWEFGGAEYTVEHHLQDVSGAGYSEAEADTEILSGTVGEVVNATPKTYHGFTENTIHGSRKESGVVAADGSLVLKLYYDRDVYNIAFDLNNGAGTVPEVQELRYGALLKEPGRPEKPGYTFHGWYMGEPGTEGKAWDFDKTVEENTEKQSQVLYAGWVDDIAPVLMQAEFNEGYKSFFDWLIRKKDLNITIPIIEEGSGVKQADYVLASFERSDSGNESAQAQIIEEDGRTVAKITISYDFKGTVLMTCTDNAGNSSAGKTLTSPGGGAAFVVEDNAPEITFSSKDGSLFDSFYGDVTVTVSVNDEGTQGNADTAEKAKITGGIASVTYSTDNGAETAVEGKGFESGIVPSCDFFVKISGVGEHILKVTATDNAGNQNTGQARIRIAQKPTAQKSKPSVRPVSRKKSPEPNPSTLNSPAPVTEQFIALADAPQPLKTADPVRDSEPRTGDTSHVEVYATAAMVSGLLYVRLYFTADKTGMTQEEKEQFLSCLISWAKRGGKPRRLFATAVIFLFLVYYHSIGKCKAYDVRKIRV